MTVTRFPLLLPVLVLGFMVSLFSKFPAEAIDNPDLTIGNYTQVTCRRITYEVSGRKVFACTYRAEITNSGPGGAAIVTATAKSQSSAITVKEGSLSFGNVPAGSTIASLDTFTIRQNSKEPFDALADDGSSILVWNIVWVLAPPPVSELASSGLEKARSGDHLAAIEDYNRAIQQDPRDAYAYSFRSRSLRALGDETGAQADIERVLQLRIEEWDGLLMTNPNDPDAYAGRAATRLSLGDADGAIDDYTTSLLLRPGHARTLFGLGNARYRAGDRTGALDEYDQALAADPNLVEGYVARAQVRLELGDVEGAAADLLTARLIAPSDQVTQEEQPTGNDRDK